MSIGVAETKIIEKVDLAIEERDQGPAPSHFEIQKKGAETQIGTTILENGSPRKKKKKTIDPSAPQVQLRTNNVSERKPN